jgi:hypothetical protein
MTIALVQNGITVRGVTLVPEMVSSDAPEEAMADAEPQIDAASESDAAKESPETPLS